MKTSIITTRAGSAGYGYTITIDGLDSLMKFLKEADPQLRKAINQGIKEAASPILQDAKKNAWKIADDGTFANSLTMRSRANGGVNLRSNDIAAGVKEFARPGAMRLVGKSARSSTQRARLRAGMPLGKGTRAVRVGVPKGYPPRVMYKSINENVSAVENRIAQKLDEVLGRADG